MRRIRRRDGRIGEREGGKDGMVEEEEGAGNVIVICICPFGNIVYVGGNNH